MLHELLKRQLQRCGIVEGEGPSAEAWGRLLERVSKAYQEAEEERYLMERSLSLSSTEMLQLNASLRASERSLAAERDKLGAVFRSLGEGLCVLDPEGRCLSMNPEAERLLGGSEAEARGELLLERLAGPGEPPLAPSQAQSSGERSMRRRDGSLFPASFTLTSIRAGGEVQGAVLALRDVSEQKRAREALEREHRQFQSFIQSAPIAMAMFDRDMRYVVHSRRWLEDYGLEGRDIVGRSHYEVFPDIPERWKEIHARTLAGEIVTCSEDVFKRASGAHIFLRWAIHPWYEPSGRQGGILMATVRVDDLVLAREEAMAASRLKAEFLANMSHEIRTPLNGVMGTCDLLLGTSLSAVQRDYAETIVRSSDSLLGIINDILDFSKIEAGKLELQHVDFEPRTVVHEVLELLSETAHRKGLEITCLVQHDVPVRASGDPGRLRQVLLNLVGNAIKFTSRGEVAVTVVLEGLSALGSVLRFEVRDTGIGIPAEAQERLFKAFSQVDGSATRRFGGTGLGLAISRQLVELMGGAISVESTPGAGSRFHFTARFEPACEPVPAPAAGTATPEVLRGLQVLIVDDNDTNRRILETMVRGWSMHPVAARDGREALSLLRSTRRSGQGCALALLDFNMPEMDGFALAATIRADPELASTQLILLSSVVERTRPEELEGRGFAGQLVKPLREAKLHACLIEVLGRTRTPEPGVDAPAPALPAAGARELAAEPARAEGSERAKPHVLLAEDNDVNLKVVVRMLEKLGVRVDVARNGAEALQATARAQYDLVLLDCQMPLVDGFDVCRELRRRERGTGRHVPVAALTAHAMTGDRERCLEAGMDDYVAKPIKLAGLREVLERWLVLA